MWSAYRCLNQRSGSLRLPITLFGRNAGYCAAPMYDAFKAQEMALVATGYTDVKSIWVPRNCPTGIGGQSCQADGTNCSLHNYGVADDIDPFGFGNPHFYVGWGKKPDGWNRPWTFDDIKLDRVQVEAVEAIRNVEGEQMFRWLGWLNGDTMHFEGQVPPSRCKVNWLTVAGYGMEDEEMSLKETLIDLAFAAGWAQPAAGHTEAEAKAYWYGVDPDSAAWDDMRAAIRRGGRSLKGGSVVDKTARDSALAATTSAAQAQVRAESAHARLDKLRNV